jgi:two-component system sensor histidine kinase AlgZ
MYIEAARRNSLAPSISEARLSALTARIRPHFLFNSLNAAISLIRLRPYDAETCFDVHETETKKGQQEEVLNQRPNFRLQNH